ncbi:glutamine amidotransferase [Klebsiella michiganensis]|uniref:glutamine amidotransferase n=1 Tax=Klebsiella michiganensis TaxID=1134687 RepID=UPI0023A9AFBA|nr:glutamine amidotransferase [Klebsiella michiganensis]MDD9640738.1 glutamine amidotransferase [Klebsiella michiganensis]
MKSKKLLLIQAGTPPEDIRMQEGDLSDWFHRALGLYADKMQVVRVFAGEQLPTPGMHCAAILTGSWAMVTERLDWSETTADWICQAMILDMPLFGVCYGHQLMAHALGGQVGYHPDGLEVGCQEIEVLPAIASDPLGKVLPSRFTAHLTHLQTVLTPPPGAQVLARSAHDPHQIMRYGAHAISTQFHPEFTPSISAACVSRRAEMLRSTGHDPEVMLDGLHETPIAQSLLTHFVRTYME